jgi:hypothetical protein
VPYDKLLVNVINPNEKTFSNNQNNLINHILTFSSSIGCIPYKDTYAQYQLSNPSLFDKDKDPLKQIFEYTKRHNVNYKSTFTDIKSSSIENIQSYYTNSIDIMSNNLDDTLFKHAIPGTVSVIGSNLLFPGAKKFYSTHGTHKSLDIISYLHYKYESLRYTINEHTYLFVYDKFINRILPDNNLLWLSDSQNHMETLARHMINTLHYDISIDQMCDLIYNTPVYFIKKAYVESLSLEYLLDYKNNFIEELRNLVSDYDQSQKRIILTGVTKIDVDELLFGDNRIDYYSFLMSQLKIDPNVKRFETYIQRFEPSINYNDIIKQYVGTDNIFYDVLKYGL